MNHKIRKEREYTPHVDALMGARVQLRFAEEPKSERVYGWMGAMLLSAFAFEGYLNLLGRELFPSWENFERQKSWSAKTELIAARIGLMLKKRERPFQTVSQLFEFRNKLAHPKPQKMAREYVADKLDFSFYQPLESDTEKFCNETNAKQSVEDVEKMMELLFSQANVGRHPLLMGTMAGSAGPAS